MQWLEVQRKKKWNPTSLGNRRGQIVTTPHTVDTPTCQSKEDLYKLTGDLGDMQNVLNSFSGFLVYT